MPHSISSRRTRQSKSLNVHLHRKVLVVRRAQTHHHTQVFHEFALSRQFQRLQQTPGKSSAKLTTHLVML